ncbi:MAG TPA: beta-ketoacyl synthase N-terminal-like domain-containing protein, partial [Burkholderiales bacterium]|nr:beta-ketoacyl synthase N-terminal-like domain-containing protein [Burkholderiales bacterium]
MAVFVAGAATTRFGRLSESYFELARSAARTALREARVAKPGHVFVSSQSPEELAGIANVAAAVCTELGLTGVPATRVETAPSSGGSAVEAAFFAIASGLVETALVVGVEKMTGVPTKGASASLAKMIHPSERRYGLTMPALAALSTRYVMETKGITREELSLAPIKAHAHASGNANAHFRNPVSASDVAKSPLVSDPLRVLDCAPISDGAAALVLSRARGMARILGIGHATDDLSLCGRQRTDALLSFAATRLASRRCAAMARRRPRDADVVEMHDAFSILEFTNPFDLGI